MIISWGQAPNVLLALSCHGQYILECTYPKSHDMPLLEYLEA